MKYKFLSAAGLALCAMCAAAGPAGNAGAAVDDSVITAKIKAALVEDSTTKARQIKVKTQHGVVQLSGFVNTSESKQRAEAIATDTEGVKQVHNDLEVRDTGKTAGERLDDSVLTTKVKAALVGNKSTKAHEIKVTTLRGVVQLSGFVDSDDAKAEAAKVAANVNGVKDVENNLRVKSL
jgi:hyperosmotically inducible protein